MKKVLFIGDIHGKTGWREIVLEGLKRFYEVVFMGDYFDSFDISSVRQLDNFKSILAFIRNKKGVTALLGNHDYAYIHGFSNISGYQYPHAQEIRQLLVENIDLFDIAWGYRNEKEKYTLATHAGLTRKFWNNYVIPLFEEGEFLHRVVGPDGLKNLEIHEILNYLKDKKDLMWKVGSVRGGAGTPGPLWSDWSELTEDPYEYINQVVGHTALFSPALHFQTDDFLTCIDCWTGKESNKPGSLVISL